MKQTKTERRLAAFIETEFADAEGARSDVQQQFRKQALQYYQGDPRGDEKEGRSQVVSLDLSASVNTTLALMRGMLIDEASITFEAYGPEDEPMAKAESDICQDVFYKENEGELQLMHAIKDGLLSRQSVIGFNVIEEEEGQNRIEVRAVPSENIAYQAAYEGDLQDIRFFAEIVPYTRSDLIAMGMDKKKVMALPDRSSESFNGASNERNTRANTYAAPEREGDVIECWVCYILIDLDGDGITERKRVWYVDSCILDYEDFEVVPYAVGNPFITPHRITGESLHDRLKQVQDTNTALQRQLIDNVATCNNGRVIYNPQVTSEEDVLNPVAGGGIRSRDPAQGAIPLPVPDVTTGILGALEFFRRKRGEVAGAATDMADAQAQLMHKSATQASIDKHNSELITVLIANTLAQTLMKQSFTLMHYFLRNYATRPYIANVNGQAVPVNPLQWPAMRRVKVQCGKSPGEKAQEAQAMMMHLQNQAAAMAQGKDGILANDSTLYRTSLRVLQLNGVQDAESYLIDPMSPQAQQAAQGQAQMEQQMQQMQAQMAQMQMQLEQAKIAEDARQADQDLKFKYDELAVNAEVEEAKIAGQGTIDLEKERMKLEQAAANRPEGGSDGDRGTLR